MADRYFNEWLFRHDDSDALEAAVNSIVEYDDGCAVVSFEKLLPVPPGLANLHSGICVIDGKDERYWHREQLPDGGIRDRRMTSPEWVTFIGSGMLDEARWCAKHWGVTDEPVDCAVTRQADGSVELCFATQRTCPHGVLDAVANRFPELQIEAFGRTEYDDEFVEILSSGPRDGTPSRSMP